MVPDHLQRYTQMNADFFRTAKMDPHLDLGRAQQMVEAALTYAKRAGFDIAVAVVDRHGVPIACATSPGSLRFAPERALAKAQSAAWLERSTDNVPGCVLGVV